MEHIKKRDTLSLQFVFHTFMQRAKHDARCTRDINSKTAKAKAAFNNNIIFTSKLDLN
jgi:hypothetical protein